MSSDNLHIAIQIQASAPELLTGLDVWLRLGLISQTQVRQLSEAHLSCPLPQEAVQPPRRPSSLARRVRVTLPPRSVRTPILQQVWQSFKEELSVRWLLFLGLFLVVLSSSVLAATQWQQFTPVGQYGVLWLYTLVFWGVSVWAGNQAIPLTARTLQVIVLLLVPINFWAMDTFVLWQNIWGWFVAAIASVSLTAMTLFNWRSGRLSLWAIAFLGLGCLQWGWGSGSGWVAIYLGLIGTATLLVRGNQRQAQIKRGKGFVLYALAVLLVRAIFVVQLPIQYLGLAIGFYGWLLVILIEFKLVEAIGSILLLVGWWVSVGTVTWQAVAVNGLALQWCSQRLRRYWRRRDLLAIFVIGLQAWLLMWWWLPAPFRQAVLDFSIQIAHSEAFPQSVHSLTVFPYVIGFVGFTGWLYRQEKPQLARFGEWLTLGLGTVLMLLSLANPTWRSLNLLLSSVMLVYVTRRRHPTRLVYLSHLLVLLTICSILDWWFSLDQLGWAVVLLGLMVAEWGVVLGESSQFLFLQSCWHFGFFLAGISYSLLWNQIFSVNGLWGCLWLLAPLTLTGVASRRSTRRQPGAIASCFALALAQALTLWHPQARLIGLGVATGLMFFNTRCLRQTVAAAVTIGFALSLLAALLWEWLPPLSWFMAGAIAILGLWLIRNWFRQHSPLYSQAADRWAVSLCLFELAFLTIYSLRIVFAHAAHWEPLCAAVIVGGAICYRFWQQPSHLAVYGVSWAIEISLVELVLLMGGSALSLATANIILALCFCLGQPRLKPSLLELSSIKILPLVFAAIALVCRVNSFTAYTGFLVLGAAVTGLGVGYRLRHKQISYISLAGVSVGVYELALYQLLHTFRGSLGDRLIILAVVATVIALTYRLAGVWQGSDRFLNLSRSDIHTAAHLHWAVGSILMLIAASIVIGSSSSLTPLGIAFSLILAAYALIQGRDVTISASLEHFKDWWVYGGLAEIAATAIYARLIWTPLSLLDPWRVMLVCGVALMIEQIPWRRLGWRSTPWHRAALTFPVLTALVTPQTFSLLVAAAFYAYISVRQRNIRWSYLSVGFSDWAIALWLLERTTDLLWYALVAGLSILYIAQVEPLLQLLDGRTPRHWLRLFGCGIICLVALFEQDTGLIPALIGLASVLIGIGLQIRAFLFIGTLTFILTAFYQLIVLMMTYSLLKWIVGLIAGIVLISLAANFEQRRELVSSAFQNWLIRLNQWE